MIDVIESIRKMDVSGNRLELPKNEIFKNYAKVKKVLINAGGKYSKNGFSFSSCAQSVKDTLVGGEAINDKKKFQFFETPKPLAKQVVELACISQACKILEPSAGQGALIKQTPVIDNCTAVELNPENMPALRLITGSVIESDFLQVEPLGLEFDRVIANPPFTKNQDIDHIKHMWAFLKPGGRLVSIASTSWRHGSQKKQESFKLWLHELGAEIIDVEAGAFKESGTKIPTVIIVIDKPE